MIAARLTSRPSARFYRQWRFMRAQARRALAAASAASAAESADFGDIFEGLFGVPARAAPDPAACFGGFGGASSRSSAGREYFPIVWPCRSESGDGAKAQRVALADGKTIERTAGQGWKMAPMRLASWAEKTDPRWRGDAILTIDEAAPLFRAMAMTCGSTCRSPSTGS